MSARNERATRSDISVWASPPGPLCEWCNDQAYAITIETLPDGSLSIDWTCVTHFGEFHPDLKVLP